MERNPTDKSVAAHNKAKALFTREKLTETRNSWHEKTSSLDMEKDLQGLWKLTKTLNEDYTSKTKIVIEENNELHSERKAADILAKQYSNVSQVTIPRQKIRETKKEIRRIISTRKTEDKNHLMTEEFTLTELKTSIRQLKTKKSPGPDGICNEMIKHLGHNALKLLLEIFNQSWTTGQVPAMWKEAHIVPILKKGKDKKDPLSYRPISLVSCVGKLMERMVNNRLVYHLEHTGLLTPCQTGYRKFRSTEDQLSYLAQNIENAFQEKKKLLAVFFDLSKAFDRVWKEGLLLKILKSGVNNLMFKWIKNFLYQRKARVKLDRNLSKQVSLIEGVPQGGVLSPTLFIIYINDIMDGVSKHIHNTLHADDLAVWTTSEYVGTATRRIQEAVDHIGAWTNNWELTINKSKTVTTLFSLSPKKEAVKITLDDRILPQTETPSFLGVNLDTRLTWSPQIDAMEQKTTRRLAVMKKLAGTKWGATSGILKQVYTSTVRPSMEYASPAWNTASYSSKGKLDRVQNTGMRLILGAMKSTPVKYMEKVSDIEPLQHRRDRKILLQTEKMKRLPTHPLHDELKRLTKNRIKRKSLNHSSKTLKKRYADTLHSETVPEPFQFPEIETSERPEIKILLDIPGISSRHQSPHELKALSLEMAETRYPQNIWTQVYTDGSAVNAVKNGGSGFYVKFQDGDSESESVAGGRRCTNFKAEIIAIRSAADFLVGHHKRCKDIVFFTDSMSTLHSLQSGSVDPALLELQQSLFTLSRKGSVTLQWIPAHVGLPGNERADQLAKVGSTLDQPNTQLTYLETKSLLRTVLKNER